MKSITKVQELLNSKLAFVIGIALGLVLIIGNAFVGIYMVDVIRTGTENPNANISELPSILEDEYENVKEDYLKREEKTLVKVSGKDPFKV